MRGSWPKASGLFLAALLAASCASPEVSAFPWTAVDGTRLVFRRSTKAEAGEEGRIACGSSLRLELAKARILPSGLSLELELRPGPRLPAAVRPALELSLLGEGKAGKPLAVARAVLGAATTRFVLQAPAGVRLGGLELSFPDAGGGSVDWTVDLLAVRELPAWSGVEPLESGLRISAGASVWRADGAERAALELPVLAGEGWLLVDYGKGGRGRFLSIEADGEKVFSMRLHPAGLRTVLPLKILPPGARRVELVLPAGVPFRAFAAGAIGAADIELADFGRILRTPAPLDGRAYDLYRWDLVPGVLVFDFRDYAAQGAFLTRLAFFVEKEGFRGRLATDEELAGLHGWNAHDYRAADLAAFFELARKTAFPLSAEEGALRDLLLERGVIARSADVLVAGQGAIISIARESEPYLRALFLTHESTHALYFVDADYRAFVQGEWRAMDRGEKWFWRLFFGWKTYDTGDEYLMANEYQAYLLQQTLKMTEAYFTKNAPAQVTERHQELVPEIEAYMETYGKRFEERASALDAWLDARYGFRAGYSASY